MSHRFVATFAVASLLTLVPSSASACPWPTQPFGPMGDFRPIAPSQVAKHAECVKNEGIAVVAEPNVFLLQRNRADYVANSVIRTAQAAAGLSPYTVILAGVNITARSQQHTVAVQEGYRRRVTDLQTRYDAMQTADGISVEGTRAFRQALAEVKAYLEEGLTLTQVPAERKAILESIARINNLDISAQTDAIAAVARRAGKVDATTSAAAKALIGSNAILIQRVESLFTVLATIAEERPQQIQRAAQQQAHRAAVAQIADVAHLTQGLVGVAALGGIISPNDAATLQGVVSGAAQLATAARIWSDGVNTAVAAGTVGSAAGPYGIAIAGGLAIVSSLQQRGPTEGEQLAEMLAQISKQIDRLQQTVDKGFKDVHQGMAQSEQRLMRQLTTVLARTDQILATTGQVREDIATLRSDIAATALAERYEENVTFLSRVVSDDNRCLKPVVPAELSYCLDRYAQVAEDFDLAANARLVGQPTDPLDDRRPASDQLRAIHATATSLLGVPAGLRPIHGPALELLADRVHLFLTHNPDALQSPAAAALQSRIGRLIVARERFEAALRTPATRARLRHVYEETMTALLTSMDTRGKNWLDTATITATDALVLDARSTTPSSWTTRARVFPTTAEPMVQDARGMLLHKTSQGSQVVPLARFIGEPPSPELDLQQLVDSADSHRTLREKLTNYARATAYKDSVDVILFPETLRGLFWVKPCENVAPGYLAFPVTRKALATLLPPSLVALTAVSRDLVTICYTPDVEDQTESVAIGNTYGGIATVSQRLATLGYRRGVPNKPFFRARNPLQSFCYQNPEAFFNDRHRQYVEFRKSDFEHCHHADHIHHELWMRPGVQRVLGVTYTLSIALPRYVGAATRLESDVRYPYGALDRCLTMLTPGRTFDAASVFAPFRFEYPLPVTRGCLGIDAQLVPALQARSMELAQFLDSATTRPASNVRAPEITMRAAVDSVLDGLRREQVRQWVSRLMGDSTQWRNVDRLATLARLLPQLEPADTGVLTVLVSSAGDPAPTDSLATAPDSTDLDAVPWLTRHELQYMLLELIRDDELRRVRTASSLANVLLGRGEFEPVGVAEVAEFKEEMPALVVPLAVPGSAASQKGMVSTEAPTRKPAKVIVPAVMPQ